MGMEFYTCLQKNKDTINIPFIYLTSRSEKDDIQKGFDLGATGYLIKPFTGSEVLAAVENALTKKKIAASFKKNIYEQIIEFNEYVNSNFGAVINLESITQKKLQKGEILFSEMETPKGAYFIINGKIKSYLINNSGNEFITNTHETDEFLG
jgi:DNA-binding response OmpR family regulator